MSDDSSGSSSMQPPPLGHARHASISSGRRPKLEWAPLTPRPARVSFSYSDSAVAMPAIAISESNSEGDATQSAEQRSERMQTRRIRQWIARVSEATATTSTSFETESSSTSSSSDGLGNAAATATRPSPLVRRATSTRRLLKAPARPATRGRISLVSPPLIPRVVDRLSDRLRTHVPTVLWQLAYDRLVRPWTTTTDDAGAWILGEYFGPACDTPTPKDDASSHAWHDEMDMAISKLIWCTYRSHFTPIARTGSIGDEEANAKTIAVATEALYARDPPPGAAAHDTPTTSPAATSTTPPQDTPATTSPWTLPPSHLLDNTTAVHQWIVEQLDKCGWQLPAAWRPGVDHTPLLLNASLVQSTLDTVRHHTTLAGLPGVWNCVHALYAGALSLTQPAAGLTTDAGWGCMLRSTQSLVANALVRAHGGRQGCSDAQLVRITSWFLDDPSSECACSLHRLVAHGVQMDQPVGTWYGPSIAAAAVTRCLHAYEPCGLGVATTNDGLIYVDQVTQASMAPGTEQPWTRPVLVLAAQRLGLGSVPASYQHALKQLFTLPQMIGIAGGRPSASLYFVGVQQDQLLYLDPHQVRPSVPFRHPPPTLLHSPLREHQALLDAWYTRAYSSEELATFHTPQLQSMPLSAMDPSVLLGFVCMNAEDLADLQIRATQLEAPLFDVAMHKPMYESKEPLPEAHNKNEKSKNSQNDNDDDKSSTSDGWTVAS